ncbi:hypothetical protein PVAP13_8KG155403 [Panicum virgatum]|uniref:Uncharacterized protein n=1 Tax=Panicum virgatum TaxID=38727 RepID=A0A8T0PUM3_PANVG|nr:hypothetical protein PVAP13_8KG155403 [Panicum virgatum]
MPDSAHIDNEGEIDVDSLDVGVEGMIDLCRDEELTNWTRSGIEGTSESVPEQTTIDLLADLDEDDTCNNYIDDGYVAPVNSTIEVQNEEFFI